MYCKGYVEKTSGKELAAKRKIIKQKQELYKVMKAWRKDSCNNDCEEITMIIVKGKINGKARPRVYNGHAMTSQVSVNYEN
jgi:hypothetical protein